MAILFDHHSRRGIASFNNQLGLRQVGCLPAIFEHEMNAWTSISCRFGLHRPAYKFCWRHIQRLVLCPAHRHCECKHDGCNQGAILALLNLRALVPM